MEISENYLQHNVTKERSEFIALMLRAGKTSVELGSYPTLIKNSDGGVCQIKEIRLETENNTKMPFIKLIDVDGRDHIIAEFVSNTKSGLFTLKDVRMYLRNEIYYTRLKEGDGICDTVDDESGEAFQSYWRDEMMRVSAVQGLDMGLFDN